MTRQEIFGELEVWLLYFHHAGEVINCVNKNLGPELIERNRELVVLCDGEERVDQHIAMS
jgi:hypothetical protein